jgi:hypothetical protein
MPRTSPTTTIFSGNEAEGSCLAHPEILGYPNRRTPPATALRRHLLLRSVLEFYGRFRTVQPSMDTADGFDLACHFLRAQKTAFAREYNPHLLHIGEGFLSIGVKAELDGAGAFRSLFPRVYLRHCSLPVSADRMEHHNNAIEEQMKSAARVPFPSTHMPELTNRIIEPLSDAVIRLPESRAQAWCPL